MIYCLDDKNKNNNVITFVIYPYIFNFGDWEKIINNLQKKDLKNTRSVSDRFCQFLNQGYCFCFSLYCKRGIILMCGKVKSQRIV